MNNFAQTRTNRLENVVSAAWLLPATLAVNTAALVALDRVGGIPQWVKAAVALFLSF
jgi:hypothetical protein